MKTNRSFTSRLLILAASVAFCWMGVMGCPGGGSGAPAASGPDVDFAVSQYTAAKTALQSGDLAAAKVEYEKVLAGNASAAKSVAAKTKKTKDLTDGNVAEALSEYEKTVAGTPSDPKANFGLGLINLALLGQNAAITDLLTEFGQPAYKVSDLFGPSGFFAKLEAYHETCKNKPDLDAMPFGDLPWYTSLNSKNGIVYALGDFSWKYKSLAKAKDSLTTETIRKKLTDVVPNIKGIIAQWEVAAKDPDFSFVLPKELLYGNADITFRGADLQLGISALYGVLASINVANSWTNDITLGTLFDPKGSNVFAMPLDKVAEKLNTFFVLKPDNQLEDAKTNIQNFLQHGKLALEQYVKKPDSAFVASDVTMQGIQDLLTMGSELLKSFDGPTKITATEMKDLTVDLKAFFANPVSASKVATKPYETIEFSYTVHPVDAFFKEFLKGAVETSGPLVGAKSGKFFTKAILNLRSYSQKRSILEKFYNTLIDPKFAVCTLVNQTVGSECIPKCEGKQCGNDGCGGSCGECGAFLTCNETTSKCAQYITENVEYVETKISPIANVITNSAGESLVGVCKSKGKQFTIEITGSEPSKDTSATIKCDAGLVASIDYQSEKPPNAKNVISKSYTVTVSDENSKGGTCNVIAYITNNKKYNSPLPTPVDEKSFKVQLLNCPSCGTQKCGKDPDGNLCGPCLAGSCSDAGLCVDDAKPPACAPKCTGKTCGDDGCGGSCGTCTAGKCNASGQCVITETKLVVPVGITFIDAPKEPITVKLFSEWTASKQTTIMAGDGLMFVTMACENTRVKLSANPPFDDANVPNQQIYKFNLNIKTAVGAANTTCHIKAADRSAPTNPKEVSFDVVVQ